MNVDHSLLFHLDIPLSYYNKLQLYYYIPENRIKDLKVGGFVYLVDKLVLSKSIVPDFPKRSLQRLILNDT